MGATIAESSTRKLGEIDIVDIFGRLSHGDTLVSIENSILNLIEQGSRRLAINIAGLASIDSAGIGMLMALSGTMEQKQGKLRIAGAQGGVARHLEVVHMNRVAALDADLDAACRALEQD
jgi:anti-anti-sigma factor